MNDKICLSIKDLTVSYDQKNIALEIKKLIIPCGVRCAIVGPNGAGKTTLLQSIFNLIPYKGTIKILNSDYSTEYKKIAYVPQKKTVDLNFPITVRGIVDMAHQKLYFWNKLTTEDKEKTDQALQSTSLLDLQHKRISDLSGGQQQRTFIARALAQNAEIYIMDEPFAGVDKTTEKMISDLFYNLQHNQKTMIVVHHDWNTLKEYFDWVIFLNKEIIFSGKLEDLDINYYIQKTFI
jgi:manganese/zinc/iron transport system ATP- binding protein